MNDIYLDHAATTPLRREVLEAMFPYFQQIYANPSSVHSAGSLAADALAQARSTVSSALNCDPDEVIFTSGGTESDNLALVGAAEARPDRGKHIVVSEIEHEAVLQTAAYLAGRGVEVSYAPVDSTGTILPETVAALVRKDTVLVSCMYANNEIGTIQPVREIAQAVRMVNPAALVHTDAVQAAGALPLDVKELDVDLLSLSAHKIYGPRGAGVLFVRRGVAIKPLIHGGGQESNRRSGTENLPGCIGMAEALRLAESERTAESARLRRLRDRLIAGIEAIGPDVRLTGHPTDRLPNHASFFFGGRSGESVLVDLDVRGIQCSSGSACHAGMTDPSHVLLALGLTPTQSRNGLRMTLGRQTADSDIDRVLASMTDILTPAGVLAAPA